MITSKQNFKAANRIHLKYVDDLSIAESIPLKEKVIPAPCDRQLPDPFRARTGHQLVPEKSEVLKKINDIKEYASKNYMKINVSKTKFMVFNTCKNMDFLPTTVIDGEQINLVEEMKILGVIISSDLKFTKNTTNTLSKEHSSVYGFSEDF